MQPSNFETTKVSAHYRRPLRSACAVVFAAAGIANAQPVETDLGIVDQASYEVFQDAMYKGEYVRIGYARDPIPRAVAAVTGLMVFASQNPNAGDEVLAEFLATYDASLATVYAGDPELLQSSSFLAAIRTLDRGSPAFAEAGQDPRVADRLMEALDLEVPPPLDTPSTELRMVDFERVRSRSFTDSPQWSLILLLALKGQDLDGNARPGLEPIVESYLSALGYEPVPAAPNAGLFGPVTLELDFSMPADFAAYSALITDFDNAIGAEIYDTDLNARVRIALDGVTDANGDRIDGIRDVTSSPDTPSIIDAVANNDDPGDSDFVEQQVGIYEANLMATADERAAFQLNSLLALQSSQPQAEAYGNAVRNVSSAQLQTNEWLNKTQLGLEIASSALQLGLALGLKEKDPIAAAGAAFDLVGNLVGFSDELGFLSPPSPEEQILTAIDDVREDIADLSEEMNERFDQVEEQLDEIQMQLDEGFADIADLSDGVAVDLDVVFQSLAEQSSQLEQLEDALYGTSIDGFFGDLADDVLGPVLNFRSQGSDLPYDSFVPSFTIAQSDVREFVLTDGTTVSYAGSANALPSFRGAKAFFDGLGVDIDGDGTPEAPLAIGRGLNAVNAFPARLSTGTNPMPPLTELFTGTGVRPLVGVSPWTQGAAVYTQLAKESPWYFAFLYENQSATPGQPDVEAVIERGDDLITMMQNGRDERLFEALIEGYRLTLNAIDDQVETIRVVDVPMNITADGSIIDVFDGPDQPVADSDIGFVSIQVLGPDVFGAANGATDFFLNRLETTSNRFYLAHQDDAEPDLAKLASVIAQHRADLSDAPFVVVGLGSWLATDSSRLTGAGTPPAEFTWTFTARLILEIPTTQGAAPDAFRPRAIRDIRFRVTERGAFSQSSALTSSQWAAEIFANIVNQQSNQLLQRQLTRGTAFVPGETFSNLSAPAYASGSYTLEVLSDDPVTLPSTETRQDMREYVLEGLDELKALQWELAREDLVFDDQDPELFNLRDLQADLLDWHALLEAYASLSLPDMLINSTVGASALRGVPGPDSFALNADLDQLFALNEADAVNPITIGDRMTPKLDAFELEVNDWIARPFPGHPYLNYTLAELKELVGSAFELAIDDAYVSGEGGLVVSPENGLLANDVDQQFRLLEVFEILEQPENGTVTLSQSMLPDGSGMYFDGGFTFTPDDKFSGRTSFRYTARSGINETPEGTNYFVTDPATVVIRQTGPTFLAVPGDCDTIMEAIGFIEDDPSSVIELAPGTYRELIDTKGKAFTLRSASGDPRDTIISGDIDNDGTGDGTVVAITSGEGPGTVIRGVTIRDGLNLTAPFGGGMYIENASPTIESCWIRNNRGFRGGAVSALDSDVSFRNTLFTNNTTPNFGGAFRVTSSNIRLRSCTIANNASGTARGRAFTGTGDSEIVMSNTIIWEDVEEPIELLDTSSGFALRSNINGGLPVEMSDGGGNIDADPLFTSIGSADYGLLSGSPSVDAGGNGTSGLVGVTEDVFGNPRFVDDPGAPDTGAGSAPIVDMGAIERQRCPADFAAPFATLDVFDVIEYLGLFDIADPAADLAAPLGVFDFADILEYLGLFDTGCEG